MTALGSRNSMLDPKTEKKHLAEKPTLTRGEREEVYSQSVSNDEVSANGNAKNKEPEHVDCKERKDWFAAWTTLTKE